MSSVYLCPVLFLLACAEVDVLAPLVPTLIVLGSLTGMVFLGHGANTPERTVLSVLGHCAVYVPYLLRDGAPPQVSPCLSWCVMACVLAVYRVLDVWPYCISPLEFGVVAWLVPYLLRPT